MSFATFRIGFAATLAALLFAPLAAQDAPRDAALEQLVQALKEQDVHLDPQAAALWIPVRVEVRDELLEYLLVGSAGASHESFFSTAVPASVINTALLALGMQPGQNASWRVKDPRPSEEELRAGAALHEVTLPQGDSLELYVAWRQADELHFHRVEDLLRNLLSGASMQRHRWVYLGSKLLPPDPRRKDARGEQFAADVYQNLINIAYFSEAYTLVTGALPECVEQTIWLPNAWLVPQRGTQVALILARTHLDAIPPSLAVGLPEVDPAARDARKPVQPPAGGAPKEGR